MILFDLDHLALVMSVFLAEAVEENVIVRHQHVPLLASNRVTFAVIPFVISVIGDHISLSSISQSHLSLV